MRVGSAGWDKSVRKWRIPAGLETPKRVD